MSLAVLLLLFAPLPPGDWPPAPPFERPAEVAGALPPSVTAEPRPGGGWEVVFALESTARAERATLAGSFNGWDPAATEMTRGSDGRWRARLTLPSGRHLYKFVLDGGRWIADPANPEGEPDGHGGRNSLLALGALGRGELGGDARLLANEHDPARPLYLQRAGEGRALVRYRVAAGESAPPVLATRAGELAMRRAGEDGPFAYYEAELALGEEPLEYTFLVELDGARRSHPQLFELDESRLPDFRTPDWAKHATWYQLFPDRFRNGERANDPPRTRPWTSDWYEPSRWEEQGDQTLWRWSIYSRHYGGDLTGVLERLDYLESLGVTALYFNPVFEAESPHRYEASDYRHVDTALGGGEDWAAVAAEEDLLDPSTWTFTPSDRLFLELVAACHARGIKVVIDGVWNHVGKRHPAYQDLVERGRESRFADWFDVASWEPLVVNGWAGFGDLPVFAKDADGLASSAVERHLFEVTRRWMDPDGDGDPSDGVDGWRLDVPMEIAMPFWERWRRHVKSINPDAYLTGEVWDRADAWLDGTRFDAVMNYPFAEAAIAWIGHQERKIAPSELDRRLAALRLAYPAEATYALMNLVDSHDTDRLVSMLANPDRDYDAENREQDNQGYDNRKPGELHYRRARLIALFQATYVGAPMIYYGDEVGMWGPDDPSNRKPMLWKDLQPYAKPRENRVDEQHLAHYRRVFGLRRAHAALRTGGYATWVADDEQDLFAFLRTGAGEELLVALNAGSRPARVELPPGEWRPLLGEGEPDARRRCKVPATDGRVWVREL